MDESLSRRLARFAVSLTYEAIPPRVIDKSKAITLHNLTAALLGADTPRGRAAIRLIREEEARVDGATILVDGGKATRMGAAFANSNLMGATSQCDSYRMLTHPGPTIVPAALATAEIDRKGGKEFITALTAGYEVQTRIAKHFIPSTQARGFRSASVYGIFGPAVATGKLLGLTEDEMVRVISLAVASASGNLESARVGGDEFRIHEPNAARTGTLAALLARETSYCAETALEGDAGFYYAFTGNNKGRLSYVFTGPERVKFSTVVEELGDQYEMLNVTFKFYPTPGYNNPVVELMTNLKRQYGIEPNHVEQITVEVNWLETTYPSPAFPRKNLLEPNVGTIHYVAAYVCVEGGYPVYGRWRREAGGGGPKETQSPKVLDLMHRVRLVGSKERDFFSPRITVMMKDGSSYRDEFKGNEFKWGFEEDARRLDALVPGLPIPRNQFVELVETVRHLDELSSIGELLRLCARQQ